MTDVDVSEETKSVSDQSGEVGFLDLILLLVNNFQLIIILSLLGGLITLGYSYTIVPTYRSTVSMLPPAVDNPSSPSIDSGGAMALLGGLVGGSVEDRKLDEIVSILKSHRVADKILKKYNLIKDYNVLTRTQTIEKLHSRTHIDLQASRGLIVIHVLDESPQRAAQLAQAYVDILRETLNELAITEAQSRRAFYEKQLEKSKDELVVAELEIAKTRVTDSLLKTEPGSAVANVLALKSQIIQQEIFIQSLKNYLVDDSADVKQAKADLLALEKQLAKEEISDKIDTSSLGYLQVYRNFKLKEAVFELNLSQYEAAKVDEAKDRTIQVVDHASVPEFKVAPRKAFMAIVATGLTFCILIFILIIRQGMQLLFAEASSEVRASLLKSKLKWLLR